MRKVRMLGISLALMLLLDAMLFTSCSEGVPSDGMVSADYEPKALIGRMMIPYVYGEYLFCSASDSGDIVYQLLDDVQDVALNIYTDPLATGDDNPFGYATYSFYLVDEEATIANGGSPVLLFAHKNMRSADCCYNIFSYDLATNEITMIKEGINENIQSLCLYGDYIIYTTNEGDNGYNIHRVMKDGTGYLKLDNPDCETYRVADVYGDRVYFCDGAYQIYSMSLDFDDVQYVLTYAGLADIFVRDGYIYYPQYVETVVYTDEETGKESYYPSCNLCRSPVDDPEESEILINNFYVGMSSDTTLYYFAVDPSDISVLSSTLYSYSLNTGDIGVIYDDLPSNVYRSIDFAGDEYIVFSDVYMNESGAYGTATYTALNLATGEEFTVSNKTAN
ncbi:MAG: DUF5050 domain-containing protein [Clostridia bacterium]|nr:DUF5050 domain-containing protein [Clostridia bacterium]